jgi:hypothetical protein
MVRLGSCQFPTPNLTRNYVPLSLAFHLEVVIGWVGSDSDSDRTGRVSLTFWKKLSRIGSDQFGLIYMLYFFRSLMNFYWIEGHLISDQFDFLKNQVGSDLNPDESDEFLGSSSATSSSFYIIFYSIHLSRINYDFFSFMINSTRIIF